MKKRTYLTLLGLEPRPLDRLVSSQSLYRLRYPRLVINIYNSVFEFLSCMYKKSEATVRLEAFKLRSAERFVER
jgi:hypothetical protein